MNTNVSRTKVIRMNRSENVRIIAMKMKIQVKCKTILGVSVRNENEH